MSRRPGLSTRLKLTLSYAGFLMLAGALLLAVVWVFLLRYVPDETIVNGPRGGGDGWPLEPQPFIPNRSDLQRAFVPRAAQALGFLLVFGLMGGWILAGRMLAPLTQITDAARRAATGSLSHRIDMKGPNDEFRELADVFDTMLGQLESHITEQQRFAANASHELRTPLTISQTLLDVARTDPTRDRAELIERLYTVNSRAIHLTEALLLLSRSDRHNFTREPVDLSLLAEQAAETLLPFAEQREITLTVTGHPAQTLGSAELLLRMVTNLVQNAIVHNLPTGGTVTIHTASLHHTSVLQVENTGHPLPPDLIPTLTEPFQRGTQRTRTDQHAGVGLGLAIVNSVVRAHHGALDLTPRPTGGLIVTIHLPTQITAG
ncbi:HAMP domain-containing histidine kinase [Actinomadura soli]|uniref:histidine kinase n=1 Tax=Actinomadura soli TaxID=2508997 RepID=A0A5C4JDP4_9ACTN|nr:HAMP domain-containing sensor histidine kinase [Actinomadura soli]TMR02251.1 HAMP domain-containing histidine kinase [Actinomadura soli]